ncbi:MAG: glycosyltransferase family 2 protein [Nitrospira sp. SB0662_bin_26]|nr:glycosyltransferase family 2 protein [Nitrospira sp. SB0662_bin_26]
MDTHTIHLSLAMLAAGFWIPAGVWLMSKRHAFTVLASVSVRDEDPLPPVSVVIPARNEERNLEQALQSVLALDYPDPEIIVVNDRSTDTTGAILAKMAERDARLTVVTIDELPDGWIGKPYALHTGAQQARGEFILFTDADIVFHPSALRKAVAHAQANGFDHVTLIPEGTMPGSFLTAVSATFGMLMFIIFKPWQARNPWSRRYMGIGAFNLIRTSVYQDLGGHEPVALRPDDDLKFGKLVKDDGYRQDVLNGRGMVTVEWYRSVGELIDGLMKNMFAGMEYRVSSVIAATLAALVMHIWPWIGVWVTGGWPQAGYAVTIVMMIISFGVTMGPFGVKFWQGLLLPLTIGLLVYIQCRSAALVLWRGGIVWRGTFYELRQLKTGKV